MLDENKITVKIDSQRLNRLCARSIIFMKWKIEQEPGLASLYEYTIQMLESYEKLNYQEMYADARLISKLEAYEKQYFDTSLDRAKTHVGVVE